jgi:hypothetical protein
MLIKPHRLAGQVDRLALKKHFPREYDRRDSEQQQVTADEDRGRLVRRL